MDCRTARLLVDFARPQVPELDAADAQELESHLAACPECEVLAAGERQADERLGRAMRAVPVPAGLRERLLTRLETEEARRYRRRVAIPIGLAAGITLMLLAAGLWKMNRRVEVDSAAICATANEQVQARAEQVEEWLQQQGFPVPAPPELDYGKLAFYGLANFQGELVPQLVFAHPAPHGIVHARVFVLTDRQFDLRRLPDGGADSGFHRVRVLRYGNNPHVAYFVLYSGDWEMFTRPDQQPQV